MPEAETPRGGRTRRTPPLVRSVDVPAAEGPARSNRPEGLTPPRRVGRVRLRPRSYRLPPAPGVPGTHRLRSRAGRPARPRGERPPSTLHATILATEPDQPRTRLQGRP